MAEARSPRAASGSPTWVAGPTHLGHLLLLSLARWQGAGLAVEWCELTPLWDAGRAGGVISHPWLPNAAFVKIWDQRCSTAGSAFPLLAASHTGPSV